MKKADIGTEVFRIFIAVVNEDSHQTGFMKCMIPAMQSVVYSGKGLGNALIILFLT
ncbi:hypothetical protein E4O04_12850 [Treponema sp. OMZ 799]|uniref:hypothetical protein n=1 Tax=Treponema sp. OMZ 799 TaxID=2563668 RepID=UPI0020A3545D|nr:hypothetical protein [Treponema sp. OMZ 799]UTC78837.1 hypothetical protein E4O04_12850 [Treponema sp. OMZ 799]